MNKLSGTDSSFANQGTTVVAGVPEGLFAGLHPQISEEGGVSLDGVPLVVIVGGVDEFEA